MEIDGVVLATQWLQGHTYEVDEIVSQLKATDLKVILINQRVVFRERVPAIVTSSMSRELAF